MTVPTAAAVAALGAVALRGELLPAELAPTTDTRAIAPGATFLALRGERFDGHAFVADAFERGAAACIVADAAVVPAGRPALVVGDTLAAYLALAGIARARLRGPVIGISGSAGKTTTKTFLVALLAAAGRPVAGTPENENNEIGVSKFLLGLDAGDTRAAVIEMGARKPGDIDVLVGAALPGISLLTNVGDAHLEIMGSREALAHAKWGLFRRGARAVLNAADEVSRRRAPTLAEPPLWFGLRGDAPPAGAASVILDDAGTLRVSRDGARRAYPVAVDLPGEHNRRNLAGALAAAIAAGVEPPVLAPLAGTVALPARRYETIPLGAGRRLIFDAYNASMAGTLATLEAFGTEVAARRIAVLGGMAELGDEADAMHRRVGAAAAAVSEIVMAGGEHAAETARGATAAGADPQRVIAYADNAAAIRWLREHLRDGDAVLLKGSRRYRMEEIADGLRGAVPA